jgi:hypothetical protein
LFSGSDPDSVVPPTMVQAYRETHYKVFAQPGSVEIAFTLRIDEPCPELLAAYKRRRVDCSAYITAYNPFSQALAAGENAARQLALVRELDARGLAWDEGVGAHPSNSWPGEPSCLVYGIALEAAKVLATRFEQNAFVWSGADGVPRLILLR